jgi:hypothetical protein
MDSVLYNLITIASFAVLAVLIAGLSTLLRQNSSQLGQRLMRWRVGLQLLAIVMVAIFLWLNH